MTPQPITDDLGPITDALAALDAPWPLLKAEVETRDGQANLLLQPEDARDLDYMPLDELRTRGVQADDAKAVLVRVLGTIRRTSHGGRREHHMNETVLARFEEGLLVQVLAEDGETELWPKS